MNDFAIENSHVRVGNAIVPLLSISSVTVLPIVPPHTAANYRLIAGVFWTIAAISGLTLSCNAIFRTGHSLQNTPHGEVEMANSLIGVTLMLTPAMIAFAAFFRMRAKSTPDYLPGGILTLTVHGASQVSVSFRTFAEAEGARDQIASLLPGRRP